MVGGAVLLVLLLALGAWSFLRHRSGSPPLPAAPVDPAEARLRAAAGQRPRDLRAHAEWGRYCLTLGRPFSALWELEETRTLGAGTREDTTLRSDEARALELAGRRDLAIDALRALLAPHPSRPGTGEAGAAAAARAQLAELLLATGRPAEVVLLIQPAGRRAPESAESALLLGRAWHALGRLTEAETAFRRYARLAPLDRPRFEPLGRFLLAVGRPEEARRVLMQDQRVAFRSGEFHSLLGLTYLRARPAPDLSKAGGAFTVGLRFDPHHIRARVGLGEVLERRKAFSDAVLQYEAAIQADSTAIEPHERLAGLLMRLGEPLQAWQQRGIAATLEDRLPEAETAFRRMLSVDPTSLDAAQSLILTCVAMKRVDRAAAAVEALQRRPLDPATAERVSGLYLMTNAREPCRQLAEAWRRQEPRAAGPVRLQARLAIDDLRVAEGIRLLEEAWAREPDRAETAAALGLAWARVPSRANLQRAREWLQRAVSLEPGSGRYHEQLGQVLQQLGEPAAAREEFLRAWDLDPSLTATGSSLVQTAQQSDRPAQARLFGRIVRAADDARREEERLRERAMDAPNDAEAHVALARFLVRAGQLEKARQHLDRALEQRSNSPVARSLRRMVEALLAWA